MIINKRGGAEGAPHPLVYQFYMNKIKKYTQKHTKNMQIHIRTYEKVSKYKEMQKSARILLPSEMEEVAEPPSPNCIIFYPFQERHTFAFYSIL